MKLLKDLGYKLAFKGLVVDPDGDPYYDLDEPEPRWTIPAHVEISWDNWIKENKK